MTNLLIQDVNEPIEFIPLLSPVVPFTVNALNSQGYADYKWDKYNGRSRQVERKTWAELLTSVDKVEEQLHRHLTKNPDIELVFMLEGVVVQGELGAHILQPTNNNRLYSVGHRYNSRLSGIYSWLFEITNYLTVVQTTSIRESAVCLTSMYTHDQKSNHTTFRRHIKQVATGINPMVVTLMGASQGLGDKRATSLIEFAGTPWNIWSAGFHGEPVFEISDLTKIDGIGNTIINNVLRNIGRPDV